MLNKLFIFKGEWKMFGALEIKDESEVENPTEFKNEISDDAIYEFEKLAKSLGFTGLSYGRIHFKDKDKFSQNSNSIILLRCDMNPSLLRLKSEYYKKEGLDKKFKIIVTNVFKLSDFLRSKGFNSEVIDSIELEEEIKKSAENSKCGKIGRNKAVIFKEGPASKIFAITTSINNFKEEKIDEYKWIFEYCLSCGKCNMHCPEKAFDFKGNLIEDKCIGLEEGCRICIEKCPFYQKDYDTIKSKYDLKIEKTSRKSIF